MKCHYSKITHEANAVAILFIILAWYLKFLSLVLLLEYEKKCVSWLFIQFFCLITSSEINSIHTSVETLGCVRLGYSFLGQKIKELCLAFSGLELTRMKDVEGYIQNHQKIIPLVTHSMNMIELPLYLYIHLYALKWQCLYVFSLSLRISIQFL